MANLFLDIMPGDDPNGTPLVTLDDSDLTLVKGGSEVFGLRCGENELGEMSFTIRRDHADATEANLAAGNYVKVRIPLIQAGAVAGFYIDEHDDKILAVDEEGGEVLTRGGFGSLFILSHAALLNDIHVPAQINRGNRDVPGYWTWVGEPYGAILQRLLEEGRLEPGTPLGDVTDDFTRAVDSDGLAWPDITETISVPIGTDGLSAYHTLVQSGQLFVRIEPDLFLHAYKTRGLDLTGASYAADVVRFVKGENILTGLDREGRGTRAATHAIVEGSDKVYRQVVSPDYVPGTTGKWESVSYDASDDTALLDKVGEEELRKRASDQQALELEFRAGDDSATGRYLPFKHFNTGDLVTLDTGTGEYDFDDLAIRVTGFRIVLGEASLDSTTEEKARSFRWVVELGGGSMGLGSGASGGDCKCGSGLRLCHDDTATDDVVLDSYTRTVAMGDQPDLGTTDVGAYTYEWGSAGPTGSAGIQGGFLRFQGPASGEGPVVHDITIAPLFDLAEVGAHIRFDTRFRTSEIISAALEASTLEIELLGSGTVQIEMLFSDTVGYIRINGGAGTVTADAAPEPNRITKTDWVADAWYRLAVVQDGLDARVKLWAEPASEPGTYVIADICDYPWTPPEEGQIHIAAGFDNDTETVFDHYTEIDYLQLLTSATTSCIFGGPNAHSGDPEESCNNRAAPCNHDHAYTSAQVSHGAGTVASALGATAPSTANYLTGSAHSGLSAEIVVGTTPGGELGGTWASPTVDATHSGSTHASRAPATSNYLVGTADAGLSAEIVVGTAPGGELGGTWASPTVDTTHAGSSHAGVVTAHEAAGDPHTGYALEAGFVDAETPAGTIDGVNDDFTLANTPVAGSVHLYKNGLRQRAGSGNDYTISGTTITYEAGNIPVGGDVHLADYRK